MTSSLILMYVYYDIKGDIKAITPSLDETLALSNSVATFPLSDVEMFLTSKESTFNYLVSVNTALSSTSYKLVKKTQARTLHTRTLHNYLSKIETIEGNGKGTNIIFTHLPKEKMLEIELSLEYKVRCESRDEDILDLAGAGISMLHLTEKDNPYALIETVYFSPRELFTDERLQVTLQSHYTNISIYTRQIIKGYGYRERV